MHHTSAKLRLWMVSWTFCSYIGTTYLVSTIAMVNNTWDVVHIVHTYWSNRFTRISASHKLYFAFTIRYLVVLSEMAVVLLVRIRINSQMDPVQIETDWGQKWAFRISVLKSSSRSKWKRKHRSLHNTCLQTACDKYSIFLLPSFN